MLRLAMPAVALALLLAACSGDAQEGAVEVFRGSPSVKITESGSTRYAETVSPQSAPTWLAVVSQVGTVYYWKSRGNVPMVKIDPGGAYITYVAATGAGYIRVLKPASKLAASAVDETAQEFDYVEHLNIGLNSVRMWYRS